MNEESESSPILYRYEIGIKGVLAFAELRAIDWFAVSPNFYKAEIRKMGHLIAVMRINGVGNKAPLYDAEGHASDRMGELHSFCLLDG